MVQSVVICGVAISIGQPGVAARLQEAAQRLRVALACRVRAARVARHILRGMGGMAGGCQVMMMAQGAGSSRPLSQGLWRLVSS